MGCAASSTAVVSRPESNPSTSSVKTAPKVTAIKLPTVDNFADDLSNKSTSLLENPNSQHAASPAEMPMFNPEISEKIIEEFVLLSRQINQLEAKNIMSSYENYLSIKEEIEKELEYLHEHYSMKKISTQKELQDVDNLKSLQSRNLILDFFANQKSFEELLSKEQKEYLQALADQELVENQLKQNNEQYDEVAKTIEDLKTEKERLLDCYDKQDKILEQAFGGRYGSKLEDELERKLYRLVRQQNFLKSAMDRWTTAVNVVSAASEQLRYASKRWKRNIIPLTKASEVDHELMLTRLTLIGQIRNHLIAAHQNLTTAQSYLKDITFPYCTAKERSNLNEAINFIYIDAMSKERCYEAGKHYTLMEKRSGALRKWLSKVIEEKIVKDSKDAENECRNAREKLKNERLNLMMELAKQKGIEINIDTSNLAEPSLDASDTFIGVDGVKVEETEDIKAAEKKIEEATAQSAEEVDGVRVAEEEREVLDEAAPQPSKNELFGDLNTIMAAYEKQKQTLEEEQVAAKAKQQAIIDKKLRRRTSRIMRVEAQKK